MDLASLRREYRNAGLSVASLPDDPFIAFRAWLAEFAQIAGDDANVIVLATTDPATGRPSARTVLLKGVDDASLVIYTNHTSRKGRELLANPQATLLCSWVALGRQVVIEGPMHPVADDVSDAYFLTRPRQSQISAWASDQSSPVADRDTLEQRFAEVEAASDGAKVERPPHWGGFALRPDRFEFWQGRENRLHDRIEYRASTTGSGWAKQRLAP